MDFLLLSPPYIPGTRILVPDGMTTVSQYLKSKGHDVEQADLFMTIREFNKTSKPFIDLNSLFLEDISSLLSDSINAKISKHMESILTLTSIPRHDVICFSIHSWLQLPYALYLSRFIKERFSKQIVFGGAYFNVSEYTYFFEQFNWVDILAIGSIDSTYDAIITALKNKKRCLIKKKFLGNNGLLRQDYTGLNTEQYKIMLKHTGFKKMLPIVTSQGCLFNCDFCSGRCKPYTVFPVQEIVDEIESLQKQHRVDAFYFVNQYINIDKKHLELLCKEIIRRSLKIAWASSARIDNLDEQLITLMADSGCVYLTFGLESASLRMQKIMNKHYSVSKFKNLLPIFRKNKIAINTNFIVGYPGETSSDFQQSIDFIKEYGKYLSEITISYYFLLYGSNLFSNQSHVEAYQDKLDSELSHKLTGCYGSSISKKNIIKRHQRMLKVGYKYVIQKQHPLLQFIPFFAFDFLYNKNNLFGNTKIYRLFNFMNKIVNLGKYIKK